MEITQNLYNAYYTPKSFYVEKYFESWDPKIHGPRKYLQIFYVAALIDECGNKNHYTLAMFRNFIPRKTRSSYKVTMNDGTPFLSSDSEMASKKKKIAVPLSGKMNIRCYYIKIDDDALFKNMSKRPSFVIRPLNAMLNFELDILSIQIIEYELYCTDYSVD